MNETVIMKNLNINDGDKTLVSSTSLTIENGEIFGLVGESGSGKTLTAKAIINLLPDNLKFTADEIWTAGEDVLNISEDEKKNSHR